MKKEYRVKKSQEFAEIMNYKKFYTCPSFAIYVKPRKEDHANYIKNKKLLERLVKKVKI